MTSPEMPNPYAPPQAVVRDITDPYAAQVPADRGARLGAAIIDSIIFMLMVYLPGGLGVLAGAFRSDGSSMPYVIGGALACLGLIGWGWITAINIKRTGQSLAKKMFIIKVVRTNGEPVSLGRVFWLRNALNTVLSAIPIIGAVYGIADALFIFTESRQCLHDKLADTMVIKA